MKAAMKKPSWLVGVALTLVCVSTTWPSDSYAWERNSSANVQGSNGGGWQRQRQSQRDGYGNTNHQGSLTTNSGAAYQHNRQRQCSDGACSGSGQASGPNGQLWQRNSSYYRVEPGVWEGSSQYTTPHGGATVNRSRAIEPN